MVENGSVGPMIDGQMLSRAPPINVIYLRMVLKHSISNGCISLFRTASNFGTERVYPTSGILCNLRVNLGGTYLGETHKRQEDAQRRSSHLSHVSKEGLETLHKQWLSLIAAQHPISVLRGYPKCGILHTI